MTIKIIQSCDRCSADRELNVGYYGGRNTIKEAALGGGWRDVQEFKHLCAECIRKVLSDSEDATSVIRKVLAESEDAATEPRERHP